MDIVDEISAKSNLSRDEISNRVESKYSELSGLITKEGAAILVGKDLGVEIKKESRTTKMKDVQDGMKNLSVIGRIFKISDIIEFKKSDGSSGKVANIFIGDDSGNLRVPLWNEQATAVENSQFKVGDVVQIFNGFARQNPYGYLEISLGKYGGMKIIDDTNEIPTADMLMPKNSPKNFTRAKIEDLDEGNFEIQGTIFKVFGGDFVFKSCPTCGSGLTLNNDKVSCMKHGDVEPKLLLVVSCIIGDDTGDLRVAFFRNAAEDLSGVTVSDIIALEKESRMVLFSEKILGKEIIVSGKVRKNAATGDFDMIASVVKTINPLNESKRLVNNIILALR